MFLEVVLHEWLHWLLVIESSIVVEHIFTSEIWAQVPVKFSYGRDVVLYDLKESHMSVFCLS